jgi:hypothetical protein|tara:strand:+ start:4054 stop:5310 length:1257 start_codon:yes stop_codon:yes gene_type:complete
VAYFSPKSQLIHLNEVRADEIEHDFKAGNYSEIRQSLSVVFHEITHWADTIGTVWGNEYLKNVYSTYDVMPFINLLGSVANFHRFVDLHDADRRLSYSDYYRTVEDNGRRHDMATPWKIAFSCGVEFNSSGRPDERRPIIFVSFGDHYTEQKLVRQPLSIAALLETTATWSELSTQFQTMSAFDKDEFLVEEYMLKKEYADRLYAPELTLYSAPVHLLAHYAKIQNSVEAYHLGALISLVCLNLVGSHFRRLKVPNGLEAWGSRVAAFEGSQSRTFAFLCICMNAPSWRDDRKPIEWVDEALSNSGLPSYNDILAHAATTLQEDKSTCSRPEMAKRQIYLRRLGAQWLDWRRAEADSAINYGHLNNPNLETPVMFDADGKSFLLFGSNLDTGILDPAEMYEEEANLHTQQINFRRACR